VLHLLLMMFLTADCSSPAAVQTPLPAAGASVATNTAMPAPTGTATSRPPATARAAYPTRRTGGLGRHRAPYG
jgi:hypothetical protein